MNRIHEMAATFAVTFPEEAAKVLAQIPDAEAAAFLEHVSDEVSAMVLAHMSPIVATSCLEVCDDATVGRLLGGLAPSLGKVILSRLPSNRRSSVIKYLPKKKAVGIRQLMDYPENTVGSRVDHHVVALQGNDTVDDALEFIRNKAKVYAGEAFVVGNDRRILGQVSVGRMLARSKDTLLSVLAKPCPKILNALTPLASALDLVEWDTVDVLPVVDREQRFLGVLHHTALVRRAPMALTKRPTSVLGSLVAGMADAYWNGAASMMTLLVPEKPAKTRPRGRRRRRES